MHNINKVAAALIAAFSLLALAPAATAGLVGLYTYANARNLGLDTSGKGNNLVATGTVAATSGVYGGGLNLEGNAALLSATGTLAGLPTGDASYTIASWINPTQAGTGGIVGWGNYGAQNQVVAFRMDGPTGLHNYWWANDLSAYTSTDLTAGNGASGWHFVAATYDAATDFNAIYIDGVLVNSRTASGLNSAGNSFAVGRTYGSEYFIGQMDNTAVFNQALSASQLSTISRNDFSAFGVVKVPEPTSVLLLAIGAAAAGCVRRRSRQRAA